MLESEEPKKEEPSNFNLKLAKVFTFLNKEIYFRFEFTIKPKGK